MTESTQLALAHRRFELMGPQDIERSLAERSLVYLPLGAIEWHGEHLPVGLDGLTASGLCLRAAERTGGLVYPPLYYGMWATIAGHPWTVLAEETAALEHLLLTTLRRLEACGVREVLIFTGHFATRQLELLTQLKTTWQAESRGSLQLQTLSISELPESPLRPDHGALFETSVLAVLEPQQVHVDRLPDRATFPARDPDGDSYGPHRRERDNVLFGILGDDPRQFDPGQARDLVSRLVDWIVGVLTPPESVTGTRS